VAQKKRACPPVQCTLRCGIFDNDLYWR
jgi:hypothetical protein